MKKESSDLHPAAQWMKDNPRPTKLIILNIVLLCILVLALVITPKKESSLYQPKILTSTETVEEPTELPRKIDGLVVAAEDANPIPVCVMIENAAFGGVRPQSGLSQASVVYEVVVEGGITRFMAVFANNTEDAVGPVRSARDTYLEYASEYDCAYVHAGGSFTAMQAIPQFGLRDIDALRESQYFTRRSDKQPVHNLYSTLANLHNAVEDHSWNALPEPSYESWVFNEELPVRDVDTVQEITIGYGGSYDVQWNYDQESKRYTRLNGGVAHTDENTGEQLTAQNIIVQKVGTGIPIEGKGRVNWPVTGEADVTVFTGGYAYSGTWKKEDRQSRTMFYNDEGEAIELLPGNTWVEIVPETISFEYTVEQ